MLAFIFSLESIVVVKNGTGPLEGCCFTLDELLILIHFHRRFGQLHGVAFSLLYGAILRIGVCSHVLGRHAQSGHNSHGGSTRMIIRMHMR